jgi:uncharacterized damage-inducible protein DinB
VSVVDFEAIIGELEREGAATRRLLERLPEERLSWKPHAKSMTLGQLAMHVAGTPLGIAQLLAGSEAEVPDVPRPEAASRAEALSLLDESLRVAAERLAEWGTVGLRAPWRMTAGGETVLELPRYEMVRSLMLNHWYHHRGQLTVYFRLLDVPLPAIYGDSADEPAAM